MTACFQVFYIFIRNKPRGFTWLYFNDVTKTINICIMKCTLLRIYSYCCQLIWLGWMVSCKQCTLRVTYHFNYMATLYSAILWYVFEKIFWLESKLIQNYSGKPDNWNLPLDRLCSRLSRLFGLVFGSGGRLFTLR